MLTTLQVVPFCRWWTALELSGAINTLLSQEVQNCINHRRGIMTNTPLFIPVILGTSRQGRQSEYVAKFIVEQIAVRNDIKTH